MNEKVSQKSILIALTGGIESTVAAYLLKKQGYKVIGIALQLFEQSIDPGPFSDMIVKDLTKLKKICSFLDIPFYAINAEDVFKDKVIDPVIGRVLSGQTYEPIVFYMKVLLDVMIEKAKKFNTDLVATGHYAKILKNQKTGQYELMVANDVENDQSYVLSRIEEEKLSHIVLPLSEIRKKEVLKISELIKVEYLLRDKKNRAHIMHDPRMVSFVEQYVPKDLRRTGNIYHYSEESSICEHTGIHHFFLGKNNLEIKTEIKIDPELEVISIVPFKGNIFIDHPSKLKHRHLVLTHFQTSDKYDVASPLICFIKLGPSEQKVQCKLYFKNNNIVLIDFGEVKPGLVQSGVFAAIYSKNGEKGKVIGTGLVEFSGVFSADDFNTLPKIKKDEDEEDTPLDAVERLGF